MINWIVRFKNPLFWTSALAAILLVVQAVLAAFGIVWDFTVLEINLVNIVNAVFGLLVVLGVIIDPTTAGVSDSAKAMTYTEPKGGK